jgi:hypothetical protein
VIDLGFAQIAILQSSSCSMPRPGEHAKHRRLTGRFLLQVPLLELIAYITQIPILLVLSSAPVLVRPSVLEEVHAFCDQTGTTDSDQHLSTSGYVVMHGTNPIACMSRTQNCMAR